MNERDLDIAWVDAELAFAEVVDQFDRTKRDGSNEDGDYSGVGPDLQGADGTAAKETG
jgi:hypothetical protein